MVDFKENEQLNTLNHSCAHVMAQAIKHLYPQAKFWVGPVVSEGFYYDVDLGDKVVSDEAIAKIEKEMKKIVFFLFATMLVASVKAQVYVGGTVGLWHNDDLDATFFKLEPEVGYNLSEKWAVGGVLAFAHGKADEGKYNAFALAPYARYSYYENKVVRLFVDGGFGFSTQKVKGFDSVNGFEIGFKPGIAIKLNSKFSAVAKCGFLGYRDDYMTGDNGYGFAFTSEDLSFGFHYEF